MTGATAPTGCASASAASSTTSTGYPTRPAAGRTGSSTPPARWPPRATASSSPWAAGPGWPRRPRAWSTWPSRTAPTSRPSCSSTTAGSTWATGSSSTATRSTSPAPRRASTRAAAARSSKGAYAACRAATPCPPTTRPCSRRRDTRFTNAASQRDAPPEGGNFDGGYVATAVQASHYAAAARDGEIQPHFIDSELPPTDRLHVVGFEPPRGGLRHLSSCSAAPATRRCCASPACPTRTSPRAYGSSGPSRSPARSPNSAPLLRTDRLPAEADVVVGFDTTAGVADRHHQLYPDARWSRSWTGRRPCPATSRCWPAPT